MKLPNLCRFCFFYFFILTHWGHTWTQRGQQKTDKRQKLLQRAVGPSAGKSFMSDTKKNVFILEWRTSLSPLSLTCFTDWLNEVECSGHLTGILLWSAAAPKGCRAKAFSLDFKRNDKTPQLRRASLQGSLEFLGSWGKKRLRSASDYRKSQRSCMCGVWAGKMNDGWQMI